MGMAVSAAEHTASAAMRAVRLLKSVFIIGGDSLSIWIRWKIFQRLQRVCLFRRQPGAKVAPGYKKICSIERNK
jgi:hypothetical protein